MATKTVGAGKGALTDSVLDAAFPDNEHVKVALGTAGEGADAGHADGKALLVQWAMENGMIDERWIDQQ